MNIVLFGDSHLGRFGKSPTARLESLVEGYVVYNCSAGGFTSRDGAKRARLIGALNPDVVIFSYGGNDVAPWKTIVPIEEYLDNMKFIFEAFSGSTKVLFISPDVNVDDNSQSQLYNTVQHQYGSALKPLCDAHKVIIVDGNEVVAGLNGGYHEEDGVHMNEVGYTAVIEAFAGVISATIGTSVNEA